MPLRLYVGYEMTDKKTEALKLALEYLRDNQHYIADNERHAYVMEYNAFVERLEALAEQPAQQQEPVVWMYVNKSTHETKFQKHMSDFVDHSLWSEVPLYGEPLANHELQCVCGAVWLGDEMVHLPDKRPPAQQEPVAWKDRTYGNLHHQDFGNSIPLYASPPASNPLTDEQLETIWRVGPYDHGTLYDFRLAARDVEAAHGIKEKNT